MKKNRINTPDMAVMIIASSLGLSRTIPRIPITKEAGTHNIIRHPPRALRGLPHPG